MNLVKRILCSMVCAVVWQTYATPMKIDICKAPQAIPLAFFSITGAPDVTSVVMNDLKICGSFLVVQAQNQTGEDAFSKPEFSYWESRYPQGSYIVTGTQYDQGDQKIIAFRIYNTTTKKIHKEGKIAFPSHQWRHYAHLIANGIYEALTGQKGCFETKILFTSAKRRMAVVDQDGANMQYINTPYQDECSSISISPTGKRLSFIRILPNDERQIVIGSLNNTHFSPQRILSAKNRNYFSAHFINDDALVINQGRNIDYKYFTEISLYNIGADKEQTMVTNKTGVFTSPSFDPTGQQCVFSSNTDGKKSKLYIRRGNTVSCISQGKGSYFAPKWSPNGKWIAFTKAQGGKYYVGVMDCMGGQERLIASHASIDKLCWSPNSVFIAFSANNSHRSKKLYVVNFVGRCLREIPVPSAGDPAWTP